MDITVNDTRAELNSRKHNGLVKGIISNSQVTVYMIKVRTVSGPISYRKKPSPKEKVYLAGFLDAKARFTTHIANYKNRSYDQIEALAIVYGTTELP